MLFLAAACPEPALPLPQGCVGWGAATSGPRSRVGSDPAKQERGITPKLFQDLGERRPGGSQVGWESWLLTNL